MSSIRRRTLTLILGLLFLGLLIITVFNLHDSNHEIAEVYDAQQPWCSESLLLLHEVPCTGTAGRTPARIPLLTQQPRLVFDP